MEDDEERCRRRSLALQFWSRLEIDSNRPASISMPFSLVGSSTSILLSLSAHLHILWVMLKKFLQKYSWMKVRVDWIRLGAKEL